MARVALGLATLVLIASAAQAATLTHAGRLIDGVSVPAKFLDLDEKTGSIAVGKLGELVGVPGDPLEDIAVMERVVFVMKDNTVYQAP
ncbi:MAG: hypothetical protein ABI821_18310 [Pseudomonadota bacterium]